MKVLERKELSIEEKAKAYDKAKYIMKEYLESGNAGVIAENTIRKAFPDLAESEDEKIRKALIKFLKDCIRIDSGYFTRYCEISSEQMIAWIEKQGGSQVKESAIPKHENKTCKENNDSLTSKDDIMIEETLYFLREYQQSNRCKDESGMQNSVSCEKWLKSLKERIGG